MPSPGDIVLYSLTSTDAERANRNREHGKRVSRIPLLRGVQAHHGPEHAAGEVVPLLVVESSVDGCVLAGQVFLKGNDSLWVDQVTPLVSEAAGRWMWKEPMRDSGAPTMAVLPWYWNLLKWVICRRR